MTTFTRRTFMKTTALTIGAVALLSQGRALADGGGGSSSSIWWDMHCTDPQTAENVVNSQVFDDPFASAWGVGFELILETLKVADSPGVYYNTVDFTHTCIVRAFNNANNDFLGQALANSSYTVNCDGSSGILSSTRRINMLSSPATSPPCSTSDTIFVFNGYTFKLRAKVSEPNITGIGTREAHFDGIFSGTADVYHQDDWVKLHSLPQLGTKSIVNVFKSVAH
ncbi:MAG: hypothetical protein WCK77_20945 [Verrucomicrobiota bacterium]